MSSEGEVLNHQEYQRRHQEKLAQLSITPWKICACGLKLNMKVPVCPLCEREQ